MSSGKGMAEDDMVNDPTTSVTEVQGTGRNKSRDVGRRRETGPNRRREGLE